MDVTRSSEAPLAGTILVVDDNRDAVGLIAMLLQECGYRVAQACSAFEAVDVLDRNQEICLVVSDVRMPDIDGFDFLRVVRLRFPSLPIVLMTGLPITSEDVVPHGATVLQKPVAIEELERVISETLRSRTAANTQPGAA